MNTFMCIDPGTPFGFAVWHDMISFKALPPNCRGSHMVQAGERRQASINPWVMRAGEAAFQLGDIIHYHKEGLKRIYIEEPTYIEGHAAAARGDLVKLCRTVGRMEQVCDYYGVPCIMIPMRDWLGQLSSKQVRHRAKGLLGEEFVDGYPGDHELDAICMGLHVLDVWPK